MTRDQKDQPGNTAKVCHCAFVQPLLLNTWSWQLQALIPQPHSKSIQFQRPRRTSRPAPRGLWSFRHWHRAHLQALTNPAGRGSLAGFRAETAGSTGSHKSRLKINRAGILRSVICSSSWHWSSHKRSYNTPKLSRHNTCLVI